MLSAALWLPADRLEAASRRDVPEPTPEAPSDPDSASPTCCNSAARTPRRCRRRATSAGTGGVEAVVEAVNHRGARGRRQAGLQRPAPFCRARIRDVEPPDAAAGDDRRGTDATGNPARARPTRPRAPRSPRPATGRERRPRRPWRQFLPVSIRRCGPPHPRPAQLPKAGRMATERCGAVAAGRNLGRRPRTREPPKSATEDVRDAAAPTPDPPVEAQIAVTAAAGRPRPRLGRETRARRCPACCPWRRAARPAAAPPPVVALPTPLHAPDFAQTSAPR